MSSDTGVDMRLASSKDSCPALTRNLTPPPNISPRLRLHFYAPNSASRVNCGMAATSTIGSSYSKVSGYDLYCRGHSIMGGKLSVKGGKKRTIGTI
jgi:hypothetical protein